MAYAVVYALCATKDGLFELDLVLRSGSSNLFLTAADAADDFPLIRLAPPTLLY